MEVVEKFCKKNNIKILVLADGDDEKVHLNDGLMIIKDLPSSLLIIYNYNSRLIKKDCSDTRRIVETLNDLKFLTNKKYKYAKCAMCEQKKRLFRSCLKCNIYFCLECDFLIKYRLYKERLDNCFENLQKHVSRTETEIVYYSTVSRMDLPCYKCARKTNLILSR